MFLGKVLTLLMIFSFMLIYLYISSLESFTFVNLEAFATIMYLVQ